MAFQSIAALAGARDGEALSADKAYPDRFAVIDIVRRAATALRLKAPVVATLDALLSCLPPKRTHHVVFASNETLAFRRDGISDRSLRRHFTLLEEAGLIIRHDSPNRKRFSRRDPETGLCLRFGFDLAPLFSRFAALSDLAAAASRRSEHLRFLRLRLRAAITAALARNADDPFAVEARPALRRNVDAAELEDLLARFPEVHAGPVDKPAEALADTVDLAAAAGQNDRHHQKSEKEPKDKTTIATFRKADARCSGLDIYGLKEACPEALSFAAQPVMTLRDVVELGATLAPMMGIDATCYAEAERARGISEAAATVWIILSLGSKVQKPGAYFRSLMLGTHASEFDPGAYIDRIKRERYDGFTDQRCDLMAGALSADNRKRHGKAEPSHTLRLSRRMEAGVVVGWAVDASAPDIR
jgi:replication initiation protein RepC